jgi:pyruvate formate lyase activating enzyme
MHEGLFYEKDENDAVTCHLCAHHCVIKPERLGICGVRQNLGGTLYTLVYNLAVAVHVDPIEKKPLFHFHPGSSSFSVSTMGCNFHCIFCQNWTISQVPGTGQGEIDGREVSPGDLVKAAVASHATTIAYTYTEPTVFFEYAYETAKLADAKGLKNIFVTNGYMTPEPLEMIAPYLHGANVDLKSFSDKTYRRIMGATLQPVLDSLRHMKKLGIWVEVTTLVIPGVNDSEDELRDIARFIAHDLGRETPWHLSRFHPNHLMNDVPPTPIATLTRARDLAMAEGIEFVYTGNAPGDSGENTYCPSCREMIIERFGFKLGRYSIRDGCCAHCGRRVSGVGM